MEQQKIKRIVTIDKTGEIIEKICDKYCKYPEVWDEEKEGKTLQEAVCDSCPLNDL